MRTAADIRAHIQTLHDQFIAAHRRGMESLNRRDLNGFEAAVEEERQIIEKQSRLIIRLRGLLAV